MLARSDCAANHRPDPRPHYPASDAAPHSRLGRECGHPSWYRHLRWRPRGSRRRHRSDAGQRYRGGAARPMVGAPPASAGHRPEHPPHCYTVHPHRWNRATGRGRQRAVCPSSSRRHGSSWRDTAQPHSVGGAGWPQDTRHRSRALRGARSCQFTQRSRTSDRVSRWSRPIVGGRVAWG